MRLHIVHPLPHTFYGHISATANIINPVSYVAKQGKYKVKLWEEAEKKKIQ